MLIPTLDISHLSPSEVLKLDALSREVYRLTGTRYSILDPQLIEKLRESFSRAGCDTEMLELASIAQHLSQPQMQAQQPRAL